MKKSVMLRLASWTLIIMSVLGVFFSVPLTAGAASTTKAEKSYEIAVVFDNSGSMYDNKAWCRAKYAMEIFSSMLNYDNGDKLRIYPMWEVTTDGSRPSKGGSYAAVEINNEKDIDKISNLYTVNPSNTPFAPATEAYNYLKTVNGKEKWIIVLTDGEFNQIDRKTFTGEMSSNDLKNRLLALATNGIKVQYLGFGNAAELKSDASKNFFAKKSTDTSLKDDLIGICNSIFQRSILPANRLKGKTLDLDLSMKNLIVFAQGSNAKIVSLTDQSGKEIGITLNSGQRKYSKIGAHGYENEPVDTSLAGQVVTFSGCPKGKYTLNYTDADAIQIFYEPDVDIKVTLTNSDGQTVDGSSGKIPAGEYKISSSIVDSNTGEDVTSHELMGNDVKIVTKVKTSKDSSYKTHQNGAKILLGPDTATDIVVVGTYLKDYTITSEGDSKLAWLKGLNIEEPEAQLKSEAKVLQSQSWYRLKDNESWKPIRVYLTLDGQPLKEDQFKRAKLNIKFSENLQYKCVAVPEESAYDIYIAQDENGKYSEPKTGKYKLTASATYVDEIGKETTAKDSSASFEIRQYSKIWRWLIWALGIALLLIAITAFRNRPVMPNDLYLKVNRSCNMMRRNGTSVRLSTNLYQGELRCEAKPCTPFKVRKKTTAAFTVKTVKPMPGVKWFSIDGYRFKRVNGRYVDSDGNTIDKVKPKIRISDYTQLNWETSNHTVAGIVYINHKD